MDICGKEIFIYETGSGRSPFEEWLDSLKNRKVRAIIRASLDRLGGGNAGQCEAVGDGVYELKIHFGPGYRVYFGVAQIILLLCGGEKSTQKKDIEKARGYWKSHKEKK